MRQLITATLTLVTALTLSLTTTPAASAAPILGGQLWGSGSTTTATILDSDSGYLNLVWKLNPLPGQFIGVDDVNIGAPVTLGTFSGCDELLIGIFNPEGMFVTGAGSRNPDGLAHAKVDWTDADTAVVSFEDLLGGGDGDFNDAIVRLDGVSQFQAAGCGHGPGCDCSCPGTPAATPEPGTMALLGLGGLGMLRRLRRKAA